MAHHVLRRHSSSQVHFPSCCRKTHCDGSVTDQHQMFAGALVHPDRKAVFPFAPEMIQIQDDGTKNNCERSTAKRLVTAFRREHPHIKAHRLRFILGAKAGDHKALLNALPRPPTRAR